MVTQNYGRARDIMPTLDASKHLAAAIPRLLTPTEQTRWRAGESCTCGGCLLEAAIVTQPGREQASNN